MEPGPNSDRHTRHLAPAIRAPEPEREGGEECSAEHEQHEQHLERTDGGGLTMFGRCEAAAALSACVWWRRAAKLFWR